ncbi:DNA polymerase III subunit beta [Mesoplasma chauliocola]|uniref:DNA polymerase III subunit beta n=1 Tax=Mesoplasma chauliocola TaxID=216427 RepID=A0A249SM59_9MOLU|nr:DNA polymerase III subunit beta [Mesoplasma chauliocola]ASZ08755.1 DNA polymerase III subunit beta [Mesoplasma chauliocola]
MKLSINKDFLLDELSRASKIIEVKSFNPALLGIYIEASFDKLTIISANTLTSFKSELNNENSDLIIEQPGRILVKPKFILELLRKLDSDFVTLSTFGENELEIITEKSSLKVSILNVEDFPLLGFIEKGVELSINPYEFKSTLNQTINSINMYNQKVVLAGMNLKIKDNKISFITTDLFRVSLKEIVLNDNTNEEVDIIIPYKTLTELSKLIDNVKDFKIIIHDGNATFKLDNDLLQSVLIEGRYPNVYSAFPMTHEIKLELNAKSILKVLNRFELTTESNITSVVNLEIKQSEIILKTNVAEAAKYEEKFTDYKYEGNVNLNINFNTKYLIEAIRTFDDQLINLTFNSQNKPVLITGVQKRDLKQVVLPTYA